MAMDRIKILILHLFNLLNKRCLGSGPGEATQLDTPLARLALGRPVVPASWYYTEKQDKCLENIRLWTFYDL